MILNRIIPRSTWLLIFILFLSITISLFSYQSKNKFQNKNIKIEQKSPDKNTQEKSKLKESPTSKVSETEPVYPQSNNSISYENNKKDFTLLVTGDVNLGRSVNAQIKKEDNPNFPFLHTADLLKSADLTIINLESPLIKNCPVTNQGMKFCGASENVNGLVFSGIDVASIANNHSNDFGINGLEETKNTLIKNGIIPIEHGELKILKVKGLNIAILGIDLVWHSLSEKEFIEKMQRAKTADVIIPFFHWGNEYTRNSNSIQKQFAKLAIDNGADLVIGSHPHWVQKVEIYKKAPIIYSHGNFVFDQPWSEETREGIIGKYIFKKDQLVDMEFFPIYINNQFQPEIAATEKRNKILIPIKRAISNQLSSDNPSLSLDDRSQ